MTVEMKMKQYEVRVILSPDGKVESGCLRQLCDFLVDGAQVSAGMVTLKLDEKGVEKAITAAFGPAKHRIQRVKDIAVKDATKQEE